jgi:8-oxo-dGTP diphosphatase
MISLVLLITAIVLLYVLLPLVCFYMLIKYMINQNTRAFVVWACKTARSIDVFFNVIGADIMIDTLIKKGGYKFGNQKETISSVIGKNDRMGTLTRAGRFLRWLLDRIEEEHCKDAINDELTNTFK